MEQIRIDFYYGTLPMHTPDAFKPEISKVQCPRFGWNVKMRKYSWQGRLGPIWWCPTYSSLSKPDKSHRTQKYIDSVNLDWTRNSQWEREKPLKTAPDVCEGQGSLYTFRGVTVKPPRAEWIAGMSMRVKIASQGPEKIFRRNAHLVVSRMYH